MRLFYFIKQLMILSVISLFATSCTHSSSSGMGGKSISKDNLVIMDTFYHSSDSNQRAERFLHLGQSYQRKESVQEAVGAYLEALRLMPSNDSLVTAICDHLGTCYNEEDSIRYFASGKQSSALQEGHTLESHKQELVAKHQRYTAIAIICSLTGSAFTLVLAMYINQRNKRKYAKLQQQLRQNQADKLQQKLELKYLLRTHKNIEKENREMQDRLFELWKQNIQICARLFQTTLSYRKLRVMETTKVKKEREKTHEEIVHIQNEVNEVFATALQELSEMSSGLTPDDLLFCVLNYLDLSTSTIKICMRVESSQALTQRKYRIKKNLDASTFTFVFDSSNMKEVNS